MARQKFGVVTQTLEDQRQDFTAAKTSRFQRRRTGILSSGSGADWHERSEPERLKRIEYARDMVRNDPVVGQAIQRAAINTVQGGFELDVNTGDTSVDDDLIARWREWSENPDLCDVSGERTFSEFEELALSQSFVDGDVVAIGTDSGQLQMLEAHRCRTPHKSQIGGRAIVNGVELDELRKRIAYHICAEDLDPLRATGKSTEFERFETRTENGVRRVFHVHLSPRVSQSRGVTALAPVFELAGIHDDTQFAAALKQQISACFAVFRKKASNFAPPGAELQTGERTTESRRDGSTKTLEGISPALEFEGDPGEELQGFNPGVVGADFFQHVKMLLQLIGVNLGMPLALMLLDSKEGNFSSIRNVIEMARIGFRRNQRRLVQRLHTPAFLWQASLWIADDAKLKSSLEKLQAARPRQPTVDSASRSLIPHSWGFPEWPYLDVLKDRQAKAFDIANCLASARDVGSGSGKKFFQTSERIMEERAIVIRKAKQIAKEINAEFMDDPIKVRWDQIYNFASPDGIRASLTGAIDPAEAQQQGAAP